MKLKYMMYTTIVSLLLITPATSHLMSWYDSDCCSDRDCGPILSKVLLPNGDYEATTANGVIVIPKDYKDFKPSKDEKEHICFYPNQNPPRIICYYVPAGS